jgi:hypothetical protein
MQLFYGAYGFPVDGVQIGSRIQNVLNSAGIAVTRKAFVDVTGDLLVTVGAANPQIDLTAQANLLIAALSVNYQNLIFKTDDGFVSDIALLNANSLSGVIVVDGPRFPGQRGTGEYATRRAFTFSLMAEYVITPARTALVSFSEALDFSGGLPMYVMCRAITTLPQRQQTYQFTEYTCTQTGQAVGLLAYPTVPGPMFPQFLKEAPRIKRASPDRTGATYRNYGVTWSYTFESATPLVGVPTLWTQ